ncbi:MAG: HAMP domain-containing protein [Candidatus Omnitrophica bacterium]|nr:HAMP domain-containing protein [Candidatus Omnitrophota bacterium]
MSIRLKLTITFLALTLIPLLFVSVIAFNNYKNYLEADHIADLRNILMFKSDKIETYFSGLKSDIEIAQSFFNIKQNLPILSQYANDPHNTKFLEAKKMLDGQLQNTQSVLGLYDIMLVNVDGKIVYASNPKHYPKHFLNSLPDLKNETFERGKKGVYFSDIFLDPIESGRPTMLVTAPVLDFHGELVGVVAFSVDMGSVYRLMQDRTWLGKTGETLIGKKVGDRVIYLNPLRYDTEAVLTKHVHIGDVLGGPIQKAVQGENGAGELIDYRGKKVVAAWQFIPMLNWGIVAKMDIEEAFADIIKLGKLISIILIIVSVLCSIVAFAIAKSISDPIKKLSKGAEAIGSGNLDYKVGISSKDELGQLSRTFDNMASDLKNITASRDELNKEIAERKAAEEELKRSNENLEQFAYVASHDLQEPLRVMASYSELLERRYKSKLDKDADEFIGYIVDGAKRMQKLINDLLAYSRIGRVNKPVEDVDCNSILDRVINSLQPVIEQNQAVISHDKLPVLKGTESHYVQLFQNLIGNAIKFHGPEAPRIHIRAVRHGKEWLFSVKDNGIGIDLQYKDRIFLIFQRLHGRNEYPGTGIGLSICKKIVETEGGRIWVESTLGKGSIFYFTIPA